MQTISSYVQHLISQLTLIDVGIIVVGLFFALEGYAIGFLASLYDVLSFFIALSLGIVLYKPLGEFLTKFGLSSAFLAHASAFVVVTLAIGFTLRFLQEIVVRKIRIFQLVQYVIATPLQRTLGIIPGVFSGLILLSFLFTSLTILPVAKEIKSSINASLFGPPLIHVAEQFEQYIPSLFAGPKYDTLTFFTIDPLAKNYVPLAFTAVDASIDNSSEKNMFESLNNERQKVRLSVLAYDQKLQEVAIAHAQDMLSRGFFGHVNPDGLSPFDRMTKAGIVYSNAGENLALSPTSDLAMQGLMHSPGHRANMLSADFAKVGVGVLDAGIYGKIFVQEFTD